MIRKIFKIIDLFFISVNIFCKIKKLDGLSGLLPFKNFVDKETYII